MSDYCHSCGLEPDDCECSYWYECPECGMEDHECVCCTRCDGVGQLKMTEDDITTALNAAAQVKANRGNE